MPNSELAFNLVTLPPSEGFQTKGQPSFSDKDSVDEQIYRIPRSGLRDKSGRAYAEFKRQLTPRFLVVWRDIFFGQSIAAYRTVHFGHHQNHGMPADSEHSYFDVLNMRFLVGSLFGVRVLKVVRERQKFAVETKQEIKSASRRAFVRGLLLNSLIVGGN